MTMLAINNSLEKDNMIKTETNQLIEKKWKDYSPALLETIKNISWTSHNIPLTESESTINGKKLIGDDERTIAIKKNLRFFLGRRDGLAGLRVIDLGCLEGGLSFEMAREDMIVTGVEGRVSNYDRCKLIKKYYELPNLDFILLDVKNLQKDIHGVFDIILCCGLLYHLDNPLVFFEIIQKMSNRNAFWFIDTHTAPVHEEDLQKCVFKNNLSTLDTTKHHNVEYSGRWYKEYNEDSRTEDPFAAISNYRSFWLTEESLIKAIYNVGFKQIYVLHGLIDIENEIKIKKIYSRSFYIAIR